MATREDEGAKLEKAGTVLVHQVDTLISDFAVDVSAAERSGSGSALYQSVADAYERIALAQRGVESVTWERAKVDGRSGAELMERLWQLRKTIEDFEAEENDDERE